jgi:creatinine amidohydrolase/Fe(II)-dependent formamide hydrolase-like protein
MLLRTSLLRNVSRATGSRTLATQPDTSGIPIIDFTNAHAHSQSARREIALQLVKGFKEMGFVYLGGHGIEDKVLKQAFQKVNYPYPSSMSMRLYIYI